METTDIELPETPAEEKELGGDCHPRLVVPLHSRLNALSDNAKDWLEKTCERFADGQGYDPNPAAIAECIAAGLIGKRGGYIDVDPDVMGEVYSESYFRSRPRGGVTDCSKL